MQADNPAMNPEVKELTAQTEQLLALSATYTVATAAQYTDAGEQLKSIKAAAKKLDTLRKSMTQPLDLAKKAIMDFFRAPEEKLARAESGIKRAMIAYSDEQDRIRREFAESLRGMTPIQPGAEPPVYANRYDPAVDRFPGSGFDSVRRDAHGPIDESWRQLYAPPSPPQQSPDLPAGASHHIPAPAWPI